MRAGRATLRLPRRATSPSYRLHHAPKVSRAPYKVMLRHVRGAWPPGASALHETRMCQLPRNAAPGRAGHGGASARLSTALNTFQRAAWPAIGRSVVRFRPGQLRAREASHRVAGSRTQPPRQAAQRPSPGQQEPFVGSRCRRVRSASVCAVGGRSGTRSGTQNEMVVCSRVSRNRDTRVDRCLTCGSSPTRGAAWCARIG